jgi:hypothetical protein
MLYTLVNLLHNTGRVVLSAGGGLGKSLVLSLVNVETERNESVDSRSKAGGLIKSEAGGQQSSLVQKSGEVLDSSVLSTIGLNLVLELLDDRRLGRNLKGLLGGHVGRHGGVSQSLGSHDSLHVSGPAKLAGSDGSRSVDKLVGHNNLLDLVAKNLLEGGGKGLELLVLSLSLLLLLLGLLKLEVLGDINQLSVIKLLELGHGVLVNGVNHVQNLKVLGLEGVEEGRLLNGLDGLTGDEVNVLLVLGHSGDVVLEGGKLVGRLGGVVSQELGKSLSVLGVLVDTELEVLGEGSVELVELLSVLSNLVEGLNQLLDNVLSDDLQNLVLLQNLSGQVKRQVLGVNNTLDEAHPLGDQLLSVISDEDTLDVKLDVRLLLLGLKEIEGSSLGNEENGSELELTLDGEVLDSKVVLPVVRDRLVEGSVLLGLDLSGVSGPQRLNLVKLLVLGDHLLDLLGLLVLGVLVLDLLNLGVLIFGVGIELLLNLVGRGGIDLNLLGDNKLDGVRDELGVSLDNILDSLLLKVLELVLLHEESQNGTSADSLVDGVESDGELTTGGRLPDVLLVVVVLGDDLDSVSNQEKRVETNTKLTNHGHVGASGESLHEGLGAGLGNCTQVVDEISLSHTDTGISNLKGLEALVGGESDEELGLGLQLLGVGQGLVSDLVQSIGSVGNELSQENLLVGVDGVDDERHQLRDLSCELIGFGLFVGV